MSLKWICSIYYSLCKTILLNVNHCNSMSTNSASAHSTFHCTAANRIPASSAWHAPALIGLREQPHKRRASPLHTEEANSVLIWSCCSLQRLKNFHSWLKANTISSALSRPQVASPQVASLTKLWLLAVWQKQENSAILLAKKRLVMAERFYAHSNTFSNDFSTTTPAVTHHTREGNCDSRSSLVPRPHGRRQGIFSPPTRPGKEMTTPGVWL